MLLSQRRDPGKDSRIGHNIPIALMWMVGPWNFVINTPVIQNVEKGVDCWVEIQKNVLWETFEISVIQDHKFGDDDVVDVDESEWNVNAVAEDGCHQNGDGACQHVILIGFWRYSRSQDYNHMLFRKFQSSLR